MADIYIIAGPPGIGKSTSGYKFLPKNVPVIDPDHIAQRYKVKGFTDYKDMGNFRFRGKVRDELVLGKDFAIELNLGYQSHYDFVKSLKNFNLDNHIKIILFFTEDIELCKVRALRRFESGLHHVGEDTIKEMYENTMPLLRQNISFIEGVTAIHASENDQPYMCLDYSSNHKLEVTENPPLWVEKQLKPILNQMILRKVNQQALHKTQPKKRRGRGLR